MPIALAGPVTTRAIGLNKVHPERLLVSLSPQPLLSGRGGAPARGLHAFAIHRPAGTDAREKSRLKRKGPYNGPSHNSRRLSFRLDQDGYIIRVHAGKKASSALDAERDSTPVAMA